MNYKNAKYFGEEIDESEYLEDVNRRNKKNKRERHDKNEPNGGQKKKKVRQTYKPRNDDYE